MQTHDIRVVQSVVTNLTAASIIADPNFPDDSLLPRAARLPSNNLGHQPLLDYRRLVKLLWGTVALLEEERARASRPYAGWVGLGIGAIATAGLLYLELPWWISVPVGLIALLLSAGLLAGDFQGRAAWIKAARVSALLGDMGASEADLAEKQFARTWQAAPEASLPWVDYGDGLLSPSRALVFFSYERGSLMPGLGRAHTNEVFVCPPDSTDAPPRCDHRELMEVARKVTWSLDLSSDGLEMRTGAIVVVDVGTMTSSNPYLDGDQPRLYLPSDLYVTEQGKVDLLRLQELGPGASARVYTGVQVLFAEYGTLATFAVRFFSAGAAVAFEVVASTIGPPSVSVSELQRKVRVNAQRGDGAATKSRNERAKEKPSSLDGHLSALRQLHEQREDVFKQKKDYTALKDMAPFDRESLRSEQDEAEELRESMGGWIGGFTRHPNWREQTSLGLTKDCFGAVECRATIRAAYDLITRAILDRLDSMGYDIGSYRDSSGNWTINAETIDNMFVGDRISVSKAGARSDADESGTPTDE